MHNLNSRLNKFFIYHFGIKLIGLLIFCFGIIPTISAVTDPSLKVQYGFNNKINTDSIIDETGNGYTAKLMGAAKIKKLGAFSLLEIGSTDGYVDMGVKLGEVVGSLSDFSISTYLYVDPTATLSSYGNFVWTFSNAADIATSASGCMFYSAKDSRYAISTTNYSAEKEVNIAAESEKGAWKHITYVQTGTKGTIYIDGVSTITGNINLLPTTLGATAFNYICKSSYASDQMLLNSMLCDFRIYNKALTASQVVSLASNRAKLDTLIFTEQVETATSSISLGNLNAVTANLTLPTLHDNVASIVWSSSKTNVISNDGIVTRPAFGADTAKVVLTATVTRNFVSKNVSFNVKVVPAYSDLLCTQVDAANIAIAGNLTNLRSNLQLPVLGIEGSSISWSSNKTGVISNSGVIISRPTKGSGNTKVTMTATVTKGSSVSSKLVDVYVAEDEGFSAYLFSYFTGNDISQEAIRFAVSNDGYTYNSVNNNNPIITSSSISSTGGVRDPHILRGESNDYYMVVTDMVSAWGWDSNRAMVLLKSTNLINWQSSIVNIPNTYPEYSAADRVWAPQTIYDPAVGKYMVYFAMRLGPTDTDKIYYAYANDRFLGLESAPKLLFGNPNGLPVIDADIVLKDGLYNLFFKTEGNGNGIKKAVSANLTSGYVLFDKYLQSTTNAVEGGCVFRMYNSDNWILMYDMYTSGAYQFTTSTDLENFAVASTAISFDFTPRHGTIIPITNAELNAIRIKWGVTKVTDLKVSTTFSVYPNPTSDNLNVTFKEAIRPGMTLSIYDLNGENVLNKTVSSSNEKLNVSSLKSGMYLLQYKNDNELMGSTKFVIK